VKRFVLAFALAVAAVLRLYAVASAHVTLVSSDPAANSRLTASPTQLRLVFSEAVEPAVAHVSIVRPDGTTDSVAVSNDPHNAYALVGSLTDLGPGTFRVVWHVLSEDGHPVGGNFIYTVGSGPVTAPASTPAAEAELQAPTTGGPTVAGAPTIPAMLRGLGVGSLAALTGLLFFMVTMPAGAGNRALRVARWLSGAAALLLVGHLGTWLINTAPDHRLTGTWMSAAFSTDVGRIEAWRTFLAVLPFWGLVLARRTGLAALLALPPLLLSAAIGHSAAFHPLWSIPLKALHLTALAAWLGGLFWLVVCDPADPRELAIQTARVSSIALAAVVAIALSGILQSVLLLSSFSDLRSYYGLILSLKVAGMGGLIAFGAYHRYRVMPQLMMGVDGGLVTEFGLSLRREIALLWIIVVLGGILAYVSPPSATTPRQLNFPRSQQ
jgi:copper transport protein